jgi:ferredoxin--NADP+ reductase
MCSIGCLRRSALVRGGVAPDHQKIKAVTAIYEKVASDPRVRFFGT